MAVTKAIGIPTRNNAVIGLLGVVKTGKSTTAKNIVWNWRSTRNTSKFQLHGHDPQRMFHDPSGKTLSIIPKQNLIKAGDKHWARKCCELTNCCVVLDEIWMLCPDPRHPPEGLVEFFSQSGFNNVDILWMAHNPKLVPNTCTYYTTLYYLFKMYLRLGQFDEKLPCANLCNAGAKYVSKYVKQHGRGRHKDDPFYQGQGFPYAKVDVEKESLKLINMNKPLQ